MAGKFILTAQLALSAPSAASLAGVRNAVAKGLKGINLPVNVQVSPQAAQQLQKLNKGLQNTKKTADEAAHGIAHFGKQSGLAIRRFAAFTLVSSAVIKFTGAVKDAVTDAIDFEAQMIKVAQVTDTNIKGLGKLNAEIGKLSTGLGVSSKDLLGAAQVLAQAGLSAKDVTTSLKALAKSALSPTFDDINSTVEGSIAIFQQFGERAENLEKILGSINEVSAKFAVESSDIITAVRRTGGAFQSAGGDLNELIALFTSVRQTTRESAESIATGFRTIFTRIQRPKTIDFLRELGVELQNDGQFVGPFEAIKRISSALNEIPSTDPIFATVIEELGGFRQVSKVIPLIQKFAVAQEALNAAKRGGASLDKDLIAAQEGLGNKITKVVEEFKQLVRGFADTATFKTMVDTILQLARAFIQLADSVRPILPLITAFGLFKAGSFAKQFLPTFSKTLAFNSGGMVPGSGNKDTVPAVLTPGEFVLRKKAVQQIGRGNLQKFNTGGPVARSFSVGKLDEPIFAALSLGINTDTSKEGVNPQLASSSFTLDRKDIPANVSNLILSNLSARTGTPISPSSSISFGLANKAINPNSAATFRKAAKDEIFAITDTLVKKFNPLSDAASTNIMQKVVQDSNLEGVIGGIFQGFVSSVGKVSSQTSSGFDIPLNPDGSIQREALNRVQSLFGNIPGSVKMAELKSTLSKTQLKDIGNKVATYLASHPEEIDATSGAVIGSKLGSKKTLKNPDVFGPDFTKKASGGGVSDTVPALLTPGEFVFNKDAVKRIGLDNLKKMNDVKGFAAGGPVGKGGGLSRFGGIGGVAFGATFIAQTAKQYVDSLDDSNKSLKDAANAIVDFGAQITIATALLQGFNATKIFEGFSGGIGNVGKLFGGKGKGVDGFFKGIFGSARNAISRGPKSSVLPVTKNFNLNKAPLIGGFGNLNNLSGSQGTSLVGRVNRGFANTFSGGAATKLGPGFKPNNIGLGRAAAARGGLLSLFNLNQQAKGALTSSVNPFGSKRAIPDIFKQVRGAAKGLGIAGLGLGIGGNVLGEFEINRGQEELKRGNTAKAKETIAGGIGIKRLGIGAGLGLALGPLGLAAGALAAVATESETFNSVLGKFGITMRTSAQEAEIAIKKFKLFEDIENIGEKIGGTTDFIRKTQSEGGRLTGNNVINKIFEDAKLAGSFTQRARIGDEGFFGGVDTSEVEAAQAAQKEAIPKILANIKTVSNSFTSVKQFDEILGPTIDKLRLMSGATEEQRIALEADIAEIESSLKIRAEENAAREKFTDVQIQAINQLRSIKAINAAANGANQNKQFTNSILDSIFSIASGSGGVPQIADTSDLFKQALEGTLGNPELFANVVRSTGSFFGPQGSALAERSISDASLINRLDEVFIALSKSDPTGGVGGEPIDTLGDLLADAGADKAQRAAIQGSIAGKIGEGAELITAAGTDLAGTIQLAADALEPSVGAFAEIAPLINSHIQEFAEKIAAQRDLQDKLNEFQSRGASIFLDAQAALDTGFANLNTDRFVRTLDEQLSDIDFARGVEAGRFGEIANNPKALGIALDFAQQQATEFAAAISSGQLNPNIDADIEAHSEFVQASKEATQQLEILATDTRKLTAIQNELGKVQATAQAKFDIAKTGTFGTIDEKKALAQGLAGSLKLIQSGFNIKSIQSSLIASGKSPEKADEFVQNTLSFLERLGDVRLPALNNLTGKEIIGNTISKDLQNSLGVSKQEADEIARLQITPEENKLLEQVRAQFELMATANRELGNNLSRNITAIGDVIAKQNEQFLVDLREILAGNPNNNGGVGDPLANQFNNAAGMLAESINRIPSSIQLSGHQTVEVVINGAAALSEIEPSIKKYVISSIKNQINDLLITQFPDKKPII